MSADADRKPCPYCAETIRVRAVVCRFCGYDLQTGQPRHREPGVAQGRGWEVADDIDGAPIEPERARRVRLVIALGAFGALAAGFFLTFHIVPDTLTVFPKDHPSFADTFVDVGQFVKRYNDADLLTRIQMRQTRLFREMDKRSLIVSPNQGAGGSRREKIMLTIEKAEAFPSASFYRRSTTSSGTVYYNHENRGLRFTVTVRRENGTPDQFANLSRYHFKLTAADGRVFSPYSGLYGERGTCGEEIALPTNGAKSCEIVFDVPKGVTSGALTWGRGFREEARVQFVIHPSADDDADEK